MADEQPRWPAGTPVAPGGHGPGGGRWMATRGWIEAIMALLPQAGRRHGFMTHEEVAAYLDREDFQVTPLNRGVQGVAELRTYSDGTRLVHKTLWTHDEALREREASLVGHAIGAPVPAVVWVPRSEDDNNPSTSILMQYFEPAADAGEFHVQQALDGHVGDAHQAHLLTLLDTVVLNRDRHSGNAILTGAGQLVGIDHGLAAFEPIKRGGFGSTYDEMVYIGGRWAKILHYEKQVYFTREALQEVERRVRELRPQLLTAHLDGMLSVLGVLIRNTDDDAEHGLLR